MQTIKKLKAFNNKIMFLYFFVIFFNKHFSKFYIFLLFLEFFPMFLWAIFFNFFLSFFSSFCRYFSKTLNPLKNMNINNGLVKFFFCVVKKARVLQYMEYDSLVVTAETRLSIWNMRKWETEYISRVAKSVFKRDTHFP